MSGGISGDGMVTPPHPGGMEGPASVGHVGSNHGDMMEQKPGLESSMHPHSHHQQLPPHVQQQIMQHHSDQMVQQQVHHQQHSHTPPQAHHHYPQGPSPPSIPNSMIMGTMQDPHSVQHNLHSAAMSGHYTMASSAHASHGMQQQHVPDMHFQQQSHIPHHHQAAAIHNPSVTLHESMMHHPMTTTMLDMGS